MNCKNKNHIAGRHGTSVPDQCTRQCTRHCTSVPDQCTRHCTRHQCIIPGDESAVQWWYNTACQNMMRLWFKARKWQGGRTTLKKHKHKKQKAMFWEHFSGSHKVGLEREPFRDVKDESASCYVTMGLGDGSGGVGDPTLQTVCLVMSKWHSQYSYSQAV